MVRPGDGARTAAEVVPAGPAEQRRREAAAVQEDDALLSPVEGPLQQLDRPRGEEDPAVVPGAGRLAAQVDDLDRGPAARRGAGRQDEPDEPAVPGGLLLLHGGCRRAEEKDGRLAVGPDARNRPRVVAGGFGLLVGGVVRFVDDDQAEARKGREDGRTRADDRVHLSTAGPLPGGRPFAVGETAVEERDALSEAGDDAPDEPRSERDLRHEEDPLPPERDRRLERGEVDLRLPASGHAVEKEPGLDAPRERRPDGFDGRLAARRSGRSGAVGRGGRA